MYRDDSTLVEACLNGDPRAWQYLVERYGRLVYSIPRRYGLSDSDADDVHQSVFLQFHRNLSQLEDRSRVTAWLITTAHRESWRVGKRAGKYPQLDERIHDVSAPDEDELLRWERQHLIREGLKRLGGKCEALLSELFLAKSEVSYEDVAERLGIPVGSIGPTRARCMKKLEEILLQMGYRPD